ncbi:alpha/beta hydrolase [Paucibacter sp. R3-3]|uniref:Alpha/beta hydrolase n=1 Tax=Roseateles agri TaxID=3098619 RepID=A0ABU5DP35_9BURK|nr:alpha/beta hydrolase [Paucibacter sp. R3-3]MDY0748082.1 alpha/beta hydrolase [Paucibacter sp. R3-3]
MPIMALADTDPGMLPPSANLARLDAVFGARSVRVGRQGAVVSVRELGEGPAVVCLHGIGSGAASWLGLAERMAPRARLIAWDAPGYGASTPLSSLTPDATDYAVRLHQLLDALEIERCTLLGHSLGALTAVAAASAETSGERAARFDRVILASPARGYGAQGPLAATVRAERLALLRTEGIDGMAAMRSARLLSPKASAQARQWVRWNMARLHAGGYRQAVELLCGEDLVRHLPLAVPVQVWVGALDEIRPPRACDEIARAAQTTLQLIADAGHACYVEQPDAVASLLCTVLEEDRGA